MEITISAMPKYWWGVSIRSARSIDRIIKECGLLWSAQTESVVLYYCKHCNTFKQNVLPTVWSDIRLSYCSIHNYCKEWYGLASGDNDRGNGDTKTNMNNHQHHPAKGITIWVLLWNSKSQIRGTFTLGKSAVVKKWEHFGEAGISQDSRNHPWRGQFSGQFSSGSRNLAAALCEIKLLCTITWRHETPARTIKKLQIGKLPDDQKSRGSSRF